MNKQSLYKTAIDPNQYDSGLAGWEQVGMLDSPWRQMLKEYLLSDPNWWQDKAVLDIGCGTGWFLTLLDDVGVRSATGVDPSKQNVALARKHHPDVQVILSSLEEFQTNKQYDVIVAVYVMVHVADIESAMQKIEQLLYPNGEFVMIVPDFDYMKMPRFGYDIKIERRTDDEYAIAVQRENGVIFDVIRRSSVYEAAAQKAGLEYVEERGLLPTEKYLQQRPEYEIFRNQSLGRLLRFRKHSLS